VLVVENKMTNRADKVCFFDADPEPHQSKRTWYYYSNNQGRVSRYGQNSPPILFSEEVVVLDKEEDVNGLPQVDANDKDHDKYMC
jgi:hypothetical protein